MVQFAPLYQVQLTNLNVDVRAQFDDSDKYNLPGPGSAFQKVIFKLFVESPSPLADVRRLVDHAERGCHTAQSLKNPVEVIHETEILKTGEQ